VLGRDTGVPADKKCEATDYWRLTLADSGKAERRGAAIGRHPTMDAAEAFDVSNDAKVRRPSRTTRSRDGSMSDAVDRSSS
jgi:hypothetical protein